MNRWNLLDVVFDFQSILREMQLKVMERRVADHAKAELLKPSEELINKLSDVCTRMDKMVFDRIYWQEAFVRKDAEYTKLMSDYMDLQKKYSVLQKADAL